MISCGSGWRSTLWSTSSLFPPFLSPSTWTEAGLVSLDKYAEWTLGALLPGGSETLVLRLRCLFDKVRSMCSLGSEMFVQCLGEWPQQNISLWHQSSTKWEGCDWSKDIQTWEAGENQLNIRKQITHFTSWCFFFFSSQVNSWCPWVFMIDFYGDTEQFKN